MNPRSSRSTTSASHDVFGAAPIMMKSALAGTWLVWSVGPQWIEIEHPEICTMHYQRPPFLLTRTPPGPTRRDPLFAEHNDLFYRDMLGLSEEEYRELVAQQVIY